MGGWRGRSQQGPLQVVVDLVSACALSSLCGSSSSSARWYCTALMVSIGRERGGAAELYLFLPHVVVMPRERACRMRTCVARAAAAQLSAASACMHDSEIIQSLASGGVLTKFV